MGAFTEKLHKRFTRNVKPITNSEWLNTCEDQGFDGDLSRSNSANQADWERMVRRLLKPGGTGVLVVGTDLVTIRHEK